MENDKEIRATEGQAQTSAAPVIWYDPTHIVDLGKPDEGVRSLAIYGTSVKHERNTAPLFAAQLADSTEPGAPELPEPRVLYEADRETITGYDADQMRAYRLAAPTAQQSLTAGGAVPEGLRFWNHDASPTDDILGYRSHMSEIVGPSGYVKWDDIKGYFAAAPLPQVQSEALDDDFCEQCQGFGEIGGAVCTHCATDQQPVTPSGALADNDGGVA